MDNYPVNTFMSVSGVPGVPPMGGPSSGGMKGVGAAAVVAMVAPFVSVGIVNKLVYNGALMSSENLIIPLASMAGVIVPVPFAGELAGAAASHYIVGNDWMKSAVLVLGSGLVTMGILLVLGGVLIKDNSD